MDRNLLEADFVFEPAITVAAAGATGALFAVVRFLLPFRQRA